MSARDQAADIPLIPGQRLTLPIAVAFEFMLIHDLEFVGIPTGHAGTVRRRDPNQEATMPLTDILSTLLERSLRTHSAARRTLSGGLEISVWDMRDGTIGLQLARKDIYPSSEEWFTVVRHFPGQVKSDDPKQILYHGRFFLKGMLRRVD